MKRTSSRFLSPAASPSCSFSASAHAVIYQAESFNNASDTTAGNSGGACTNNANVNVDIQGTTDAGGGCNVGWIAQGEWLAFNGLNVPTTGSYTIRLRVASPSGATASVDLNAGTIQLGNFAIPATGGWQNLDDGDRAPSRSMPAPTTSECSRRPRDGTSTGSKWCRPARARRLVWSDEFNSINTATWNHEVGGGGWGNNEREYYTAGNNAFIQFDSQAGSNVLVLEARRDNPGNYNCWYGRCEYTSSRMNTVRQAHLPVRPHRSAAETAADAGHLARVLDAGQRHRHGRLAGLRRARHHGARGFRAQHHAWRHAWPELLGQYALRRHELPQRAGRCQLPRVRDRVEFHERAVVRRWRAVLQRDAVPGAGLWQLGVRPSILPDPQRGRGWQLAGQPDGSSVFPQRMYVDYIRVYQ